MRQPDVENMQGMGKDDWIKFRLNRTYDNPYPDVDLEIHLCPQSPSEIVPWNVAAKNVALDIASKYDNLYVAMSGGIDSEFIARTFFELGVPFTPIIFELEYELNALDIWWAYKWCRENGLEPKVIKADTNEWVKKFIDISKTYCGRFGSGNGTMSYLYDYVRENNGFLVTGSGFPEYFPDENLNYMSSRYVDRALHNEDGTEKPGYLIHEPDVIQHLMYPEMPFNFLSWSPEIVLSYISHRDMSMTSAENKAKIMGCLPRPKNIGVAEYFFVNHPVSSRWVQVRKYIGKSEVGYLGSRDELIQLLRTGKYD